MSLYDVNVSLLLDADSEDNALNRARAFLSGKATLDYNYMTHKAELVDDEGHESLEALREG